MFLLNAIPFSNEFQLLLLFCSSSSISYKIRIHSSLIFCHILSLTFDNYLLSIQLLVYLALKYINLSCSCLFFDFIQVPKFNMFKVFHLIFYLFFRPYSRMFAFLIPFLFKIALELFKISF